MRLTEVRAGELLRTHNHGFMATQHPTDGIDIGPIVYAAVDGYLGSPIDLVKPKTSVRLQRERNLEDDPRATLAIERWDRDDWSKLWWVRARLRWLGREPGDVADALGDRLAAAFAQYREKPFAAVLVFQVTDVTGWASTEEAFMGENQ